MKLKKCLSGLYEKSNCYLRTNRSWKNSFICVFAKTFYAEIISGDSVQVYRKLDIGSAKITESEKEGVPTT